MADAGAIYDHETEEDIRAQAEVFREAWQEREPKAVANFLASIMASATWSR